MKIGNKEVLFKAKCEFNNDFGFGLPYYAIAHGKNGASYVLKMQEFDEDGQAIIPGVNVLEETLCEYVGIEDFNNVKLFTGDRVLVETRYYEGKATVVFNEKLRCYGVEYDSEDLDFETFEGLSEAPGIEILWIGNVFSSWTKGENENV